MCAVCVCVCSVSDLKLQIRRCHSLSDFPRFSPSSPANLQLCGAGSIFAERQIFSFSLLSVAPLLLCDCHSAADVSVRATLSLPTPPTPTLPPPPH